MAGPDVFTSFLACFTKFRFTSFVCFFLKNIFFLGMKKLLFIFSRFEKKVFSSLVRFFTPLVAAVFVVVQSSLFALFWLSFIY